MHTVHFFLASLLALHVCWFSHHASATPPPPAINNTLNIPVASADVDAAVFSLDTYRAFYFTLEQPSKMVEVFMPPDGDMSYFDPVNVTDGSGVGQYVLSAVQVPSTSTYDPESNTSSTIYLCSSQGSRNTLLKYNITTPPFSEVLQPSTFQFAASVDLPVFVQSVDSFLLVNDVLYISYVLPFPLYSCLSCVYSTCVMPADTLRTEDLSFKREANRLATL
jgi:hypothetical protein